MTNERLLALPATEASSISRKTRCLRRARHRVPQVQDVLERREVLSSFPFTGTYNGDYSVLVEGPGPTQTVSGTISVTIAATSVQSIGDDLDQAYISGSVTVTGFVGQSATYPFVGNDNQQENGVEIGNALTGLEPSVEIYVTTVNPTDIYDYVFIEGYCTNNTIVASCDISMNNWDTPNAAPVTLGGAPTAPGSPSSPGPIALNGGSVVNAKKGASDVVVDFSGPLSGGNGLPLGDFRLTTVAKGRKHAKVIPLASAAYDAATDTITLVPRRKQKLKLPLELTVSGLAGGSYSMEIDTRGTSIASVRAGHAWVIFARKPAGTVVTGIS
jgi:hypothetical protein